MRSSVEFLLGLLDVGVPALLAQEDWDGDHRALLLLWQGLGFIDSQPGVTSVAACPCCIEGTPYLLGKRWLCPVCTSSVDPAHRLRWQVRLPEFLDWIAGQWRLRGGVRRIDDALWQLGTWESPTGVFECFYRRGESLSEGGQNRLLAYHQALVLHGVPFGQRAVGIGHPHLHLSELLTSGETLTLADLSLWLRPRCEVRFDEASGALYSGTELLGEIPLGTREYHLLVCLAAHWDAFVSYADLKRYVLRHSGSLDTTDEANFCQRLKSRIKKRWLPAIDRLIVTSSKGDGYRLRRVTAA